MSKSKHPTPLCASCGDKMQRNHEFAYCFKCDAVVPFHRSGLAALEVVGAEEFGKGFSPRTRYFRATVYVHEARRLVKKQKVEEKATYKLDEHGEPEYEDDEGAEKGDGG